MKSLAYRTGIILAASLVLPASAPAHPEIPGEPFKGPFALVGGTIHPVSGPPIEDGILLCEGDRIIAVGRDVQIPPGASQLSIPGKHVYPGLINASGSLGLVEVDAVRATRDETETGTINSSALAQVAFNPDSELIPVARSNGILASLAIPSGQMLVGRSALMRLDGWTWEDMTVQPVVALHLQWPPTPTAGDLWPADADSSRVSEGEQKIRAVYQAFDDALAYRRAKEAAANGGAAPPHDARWEALLPVFSGEIPLAIHADMSSSIQAAVSMAERYRLRMILVGGYDAPHCAELLLRREIPVIVEGVHRLPRRRGDPYDDPFTVPERLRRAGVKFCIAGGGRFGASNLRNLPYHAATAAAYGLPAQEALRAITLYPAEILEVRDRLGSLDVGKEATMIVTDGDPLEIATQVELAFIAGRPVSLQDRHKRLWHKYDEKYRRLDQKP